jgi:uncharacterized membrane protein
MKGMKRFLIGLMVVVGTVVFMVSLTSAETKYFQYIFTNTKDLS